MGVTYVEHVAIIDFLRKLEKGWNKSKPCLYEFEVFGPGHDIFLDIKGANGIRKVMAKYSAVKHFFKICELESMDPLCIKPADFYYECNVTTINYVTDKGQLFHPNSYNNHMSTLRPIEVIYQDDKTTIVYWSDNSKTIVSCSDDDAFSKEAGLALAYMKRLMGGNDKQEFHKMLKTYVAQAKVKHNVKLYKEESMTIEPRDLEAEDEEDDRK